MSDRRFFLRVARQLIVALMCSGLWATTALSADVNRSLFFVPNQGQAHGDWDFVAHGDAATYALSARHLALLPAPIMRTVDETRSAESDSNDALSTEVPLLISFVNARLDGEVQGEGKRLGVSHYLYGSDPTKWVREAANYDVVRYSDIYDGIDLVYQNNNGKLRFDFELAPHADPGQIAMRFPSESDVEIAANGSLLVKRDHRNMVQHAPYVYTRAKDGITRPIESRYRLDNEGNVRFELAEFPRAQPLVIDPTVEFSTFVGGTQFDTVHTLMNTPTGIVAIGITRSSDFPTVNAIQDSLVPSIVSSDIFITRYTSDFSEVVFTTFYGGSGSETPTSVLEAANGDVIFAGSTSSPDFPTQNGFDTTFAGGDRVNLDGFITRLSSSGDAVVFSSYVGGYDADMPTSLVTNFGRETVRELALSEETGRLYLVGNTGASDFPITDEFQGRGCFESDDSINPVPFGFRTDAFVIQMDAMNGAIYKSFCFGGPEGRTAGRGIAVDDEREAVFVSGYTNSTFIPVTPDAFQPQISPTPPQFSFNFDFFVVKFDRDLNDLVAGTYFGGSSDDLGLKVQVDSSGHPVVIGLTPSVDMPMVEGGFQESNESLVEDGFARSGYVMSLDRDLTTLRFASYLGGKGDNTHSNFRLDEEDRIYMSGETDARNYPLRHAIQTERGLPHAAPREEYPGETGMVGESLALGVTESGELGVAYGFAMVARRAADGGAASNVIARQLGSSWLSVTETTEPHYPSTVAIAGNVDDLSASLANDVIVGNCSGPHQVYVSDDLGGFNLVTEVPSPIACVTVMELIRVDSDVNLDLLVSDGSVLYFHPGDGDGHFGAPEQLMLEIDSINQIKRLPGTSDSARRAIFSSALGEDTLVDFSASPPTLTALFDGDERATRSISYGRDRFGQNAVVFGYANGPHRIATATELVSGVSAEFGDPSRALDGVVYFRSTGAQLATLETDQSGNQSLHLYEYKEDGDELVELNDQRIALASSHYVLKNADVWMSGTDNVFMTREGGKLFRGSFGHNDVVVSVLNKNASDLVFSTYWGGDGFDSTSWAIDVPRGGKIAIGGYTFGDATVLANPLQDAPASGAPSGFVSVITIDDLLDDDADSINNHIDNCTKRQNVEQTDTDGDGYGNACDGDFNQDLAVNFQDFVRLRDAFNSTDDLVTDLNGDGVTNFLDLSAFSQLFLEPVGPSNIDLN